MEVCSSLFLKPTRKLNILLHRFESVYHRNEARYHRLVFTVAALSSREASCVKNAIAIVGNGVSEKKRIHIGNGARSKNSRPSEHKSATN